MKSLNRVTLCGSIGTDLEVKYTTAGNAVLTFNLATNSNYKDKSGQWQEITEWHRVTVWNKQAEVIAQYCKKGSKLYVEGRLTTRKWQDKDGNDKYTTEIMASDFMFAGNQGGGDVPQKEDTTGANAVDIEEDDDIPF